MTARFYDAWHAPEPTPAPAAAPALEPAAGADAGRRYAVAALTDECRQMAEAPEGTRNHTLNTAAFRMGRHIGAGNLSREEAADALTAAARAAGLPDHEIRQVLRVDRHNGGLDAGSAHPRIPTPLPPIHVLTETTIDEITGEVTETETDFWAARDYLAHIRTFALARMTSPWSVLGVVILRALAQAPPHIVLPPLIGGPGSLNLFCALVGPSGVGKGATEAAAADAVWMPETVYTAPVGSGEGIAHQYAHREKGEVVQDRAAVLFTVPEVDTLTALGSRQGATLLSQLRSAFSGERLGFGYADALKRIPIEKHTYRLGLTLGVQPEKAAALLDDADGGTPQRFIWLPATDPDITDQPPPEPEPWRVTKPDWHQCEKHLRTGQLRIPLPDSVAATIRQAHAARARGEGEALDGHALFAREKVATALAFLDGRCAVDELDWELSGAVMAISDHTRKNVQQVISSRAAKSEQARTDAHVARSVAAAEAVEDAPVRRVCRNLARHVQTAGEIGWNELSKKLASRDKQHFEDAVDRLVDAGTVTVEGDESHRRIRAVKQ